MKKIYTLVLVFFLVNFIFAQTESKTLLLTKALNSKELEVRLHYIKDIRQQGNTNQINNYKTSENDLYKKLSEVYQEFFTSEEIANMLTFYNTNLGKKIIENQEKIIEKTSLIKVNWEMKQQGIVIEEIVPPVFEMASQKKELQKDVVQKVSEIPKITNLEDLKKLINRQPDLMGNPRLFEEILGKQEFEKLYNK